MEGQYDGFLMCCPNPSAAEGSGIRDRVQRGRTSLRYFLGDDLRRSRFFENSVNDDRIIAIKSGDEMIGYAAFYLRGKGPLSPAFPAFVSEYGLLKGFGNFLLFNATEPRAKASTLYIYNINVDAKQRGKGAGSALIDAISDLAVMNGCTSVKLQVAAHNRAMILYLKKGFVVTGAMKMRWLRHFFPFECLVDMELRLAPTRVETVPVAVLERVAEAA
jgi:ribosomal protein S18 acetylase RimI-like enzyme